jgi:uncharacterized RDD family membrane protein YckC
MTAVEAQEVARRVHGTPPAAAEATGPRYIGLITRAIAFAIDAAIVNGVAAVTGAVVVLILSLFPLGSVAKTVLVAVGGAVFLLWVIAYFATFWATTGQTPGNRVMRIRVMRPSGARVHAWRAMVRVGGVVLAALPLFAGFLPILFTERRRGLADWLADTVVVNAQD